IMPANMTTNTPNSKNALPARTFIPMALLLSNRTIVPWTKSGVNQRGLRALGCLRCSGIGAPVLPAVKRLHQMVHELVRFEGQNGIGHLMQVQRAALSRLFGHQFPNLVGFHPFVSP